MDLIAENPKSEMRQSCKLLYCDMLRISNPAFTIMAAQNFRILIFDLGARQENQKIRCTATVQFFVKYHIVKFQISTTLENKGIITELNVFSVDPIPGSHDRKSKNQRQHDYAD